jgi:hypothetical protein
MLNQHMVKVSKGSSSSMKHMTLRDIGYWKKSFTPTRIKIIVNPHYVNGKDWCPYCLGVDGQAML